MTKCVQSPYSLSYRLSIQSCGLRHARNPAMPQLLGLKSGERPALAHIHRAQTYVLMSNPIITIYRWPQGKDDFKPQ